MKTQERVMNALQRVKELLFLVSDWTKKPEKEDALSKEFNDKKLKMIEDKSGRDRSKPKFSARTLDIDIVLQINDAEEILFESDEIEKYDVESFGSLIENDNLFPEKINVSFAKLKSDNHIVLNVWERGAGKTNACGTAACATAVAGVEMGLIKNKVTVTLPGGDLEIYYKSSDNIIMTGPTEINFTDKYKL